MTPTRPRETSGLVAPPPCLYCGAASYALLFDNVRDRLGYVQGRWSFWRCLDCGSATLSPFPAADALPSLYPPVYSFAPELGQQSSLTRLLARLEHRFFFEPQYEAQARRVLRGIRWNRRRGQRLLDVGCGRGLRLLAFRRRGFEVQGADFQPQNVEYLQGHLGIPAVCSEVDALSRQFPPASFDLITAFYVLEHIPSVEVALRTCFELLKPGGWFVGAVPFVDGLQARLLKTRWVNVAEPRHLSLPSHEGMRRACSRAGFDQVAFRPDSTLGCAGAVGLSLLPGAATTHVYGRGRLMPLLTRLMAGAFTLLSIPLCLGENYLFRRTSAGMAFAHKPDRQGSEE